MVDIRQYESNFQDNNNVVDVVKTQPSSAR